MPKVQNVAKSCNFLQYASKKHQNFTGKIFIIDYSQNMYTAQYVATEKWKFS